MSYSILASVLCRSGSFPISDGISACLCGSILHVCMKMCIHCEEMCVLYVCVHTCVQCSVPAVSSDVVTPLSVSCCVSRSVLRSWMLSQYRCWGWWASGTDNTLIAQWWTAGKLFSFCSLFPHPPLNTMTTCCTCSSEVCVCVCVCAMKGSVGVCLLFESTPQ